jgi:hypothetical protein
MRQIFVLGILLNLAFCGWTWDPDVQQQEVIIDPKTNLVIPLLLATMNEMHCARWAILGLSTCAILEQRFARVSLISIFLSGCNPSQYPSLLTILHRIEPLATKEWCLVRLSRPSSPKSATALCKRI